MVLTEDVNNGIKTKIINPLSEYKFSAPVTKPPLNTKPPSSKLQSKTISTVKTMRTSTTPISSGTKIQISDKKNLDNTPKLMRKNSKAGISVASPNLGSKEIRRNSIASGR
jgi:hypothetical protein